MKEDWKAKKKIQSWLTFFVLLETSIWAHHGVYFFKSHWWEHVENWWRAIQVFVCFFDMNSFPYYECIYFLFESGGKKSMKERKKFL